jgi:hypothetical protein
MSLQVVVTDVSGVTVTVAPGAATAATLASPNGDEVGLGGTLDRSELCPVIVGAIAGALVVGPSAEDEQAAAIATAATQIKHMSCRTPL